MGQGGSAPAAPSQEELSHRLTNTFAEKCLTPLELYCFKSVFKSLADTESGVRYWSESTLIRYLELPDILHAGPIIFHLCSYLGAFPFPSNAPAILTNEALLRVVVILTGRHAKVLKGGKETWRREIWRGCAVFDRILSPTEQSFEASLTENAEATETAGPTEHTDNYVASETQGFAVDQVVIEDEEGLEYDEDELVLAAFESMDAVEVFKYGERRDVLHAMIPTDNFLKLLELFLLIAPLGAQESVAIYGAQLDETRLEGLRLCARCILASFGVEHDPGISYRVFDKVMSNALPHLFDALQPLFERFLFSRDIDKLHLRKASLPNTTAASSVSKKESVGSSVSANLAAPVPEPLLSSEGDIMDLNILSQLSFIFSGRTVFRNLQSLYIGDKHGFSMGQFEKCVFNWQAPSIILVSGRLISPQTRSPNARAFIDQLHHQRLSGSVDAESEPSGRSKRLVYGAYVPVPWKSTHKSTFSTSQTLLFQLSPVHDVFPASEVSTYYAYFNKPPSTYPGIGFGSPLPNHSSSVHSSTVMRSSFSTAGSGAGSPRLTRRSSLIGDEHLPLGPVSLHIDDALEFACFTNLGSGGGSFHPSRLPRGARPGNDWQDRFEIDALEVWGVGGSEIADAQKKAWAWEEREAEARRRVNLGTGDIEADRELLRMAGLVGGGERTGGSMA